MNKKISILTSLSISSVLFITGALALSNNSNLIFNVGGVYGDTSDYTVTLDNSNAYTSGTNKDITTSSGSWTINFEYSNASASSTGHVVLNDGGTINNTSLVKSINYLCATYTGSGSLKVKTSFDGTSFGSYWDVTSGYAYALPSNPYYVSFLASGTVDINSIVLQYTCVDNSEAAGTVTGEEFKLVHDKSEIKEGDSVYLVSYDTKESAAGNLTTTLSTNNANRPWYPNGESVTGYAETLAKGYVTWTAHVENGGKYRFTAPNGKDLYYYTNGKNYSINIGDSYTISGKTTNIVSTYNANNLWDWNILDASKGTGSLSGYASYSTAADDIYLCYTGGYGTFRGYNTNYSGVDVKSYEFMMYKKVDVVSYNTPKDLVGFTAVDGNALTYRVGDIYQSANALNVTAHYSDGTTANVSSKDYTYKVSTDMAGNNVVDKTTAFVNDGKYYVTVSYMNLVPSIIEINVDPVVTSLTLSMSNKTYNTSDTIVLANNLTANLIKSNGQSTTTTYANFAANDLSVTLLDPNGVAHSLTSPFGTAGTWTIKVAWNNSETIYSTIDLTVKVVNVVSVTLDQASTSLEVGDTVQLKATISPANATNANVSWASVDENIASVDQTGLVTALNVGKTTIVVTSEDGSFTSSCEITVTAKAVLDKWELVSDANTLQSGDKLVIASHANGKVAGNISSSVMSNVDSTFATDGSEITTLSESAVVLTLGGTKDAWTLSNESGQLLGATAVKKVAWDKGTTTWSISITKDEATIQNGTSSYGRFLYNVNTPRFTTYTSDASTSMVLPNLYRGGSSVPVYATSISLPSTQTVYVGGTTQLTPTVEPSNMNQAITWSSSNTAVATVSNGVVTGLKAGTTTITASTVNEAGTTLTAQCSITVSTISVTGVSLSSTTLELGVGNSKVVTATVSPSNASNKNVTWSTSKSSVATVSEGTITAVSIGTATITATTVDGGYKATCTVTVTEKSLPRRTVMIYMCGSDLESNYASSNQGLATGDITEILSVAGQPDDVNIIIETGGAKTWSSKYGISSSKLTRYHVSNKSLVKDTTLSSYSSMGLSSTFQSFLEWGMSSYEAQEMGVVLWNHGGGMYGVCYDEKNSDDSLLNSEVNTALRKAFSAKGRTEKLEWIGYDACLMQVQDIADFNSQYFNYMVASEESESGYGWDYDNWVDDLYSSTNTTKDVLKAIVDSFIKDNGGTSSLSNDQTLSYLDLSKMSAYKTAWENMAAQIYNNVTSSNQSAFCKLVNSVKYYADTDYTYFCLYDAKDFINKLSANSTFNPGSTYTNAVLTAFSNLVVYSSCGKGAGNSYGLCMFFCANSKYSSSASSVYTSSETNFTNWLNLQKLVGYL